MSTSPSVLIVEDEAIVATDLSQMLRRKGYQAVGYATSGPEAISKARALRPDIILMDVRLNGPMKGTEAAREIKAEREVAIVFITAWNVASDLGPGSRCIIKPFAPAQVCAEIEAARAELSINHAAQTIRAVSN